MSFVSSQQITNTTWLCTRNMAQAFHFGEKKKKEVLIKLGKVEEEHLTSRIAC